MAEASGAGSASTSSGELADEMCAGTVIRSPHLCQILYNFLSGDGLLPHSLSEKQLVERSFLHPFIGFVAVVIRLVFIDLSTRSIDLSSAIGPVERSRNLME